MLVIDLPCINQGINGPFTSYDVIRPVADCSERLAQYFILHLELIQLAAKRGYLLADCHGSGCIPLSCRIAMALNAVPGAG